MSEEIRIVSINLDKHATSWSAYAHLSGKLGSGVQMVQAIANNEKEALAVVMARTEMLLNADSLRGAASDPLMSGEVPPVTLPKGDEIQRELLGCKDDLREINRQLPNEASNVFVSVDNLQKRLTSIISLLP